MITVAVSVSVMVAVVAEELVPLTDVVAVREGSNVALKDGREDEPVLAKFVNFDKVLKMLIKVIFVNDVDLGEGHISVVPF